MSKTYIVIQQHLWCNESGHGIEYASDCLEFDKRDKAIRHGLKMQGSDDFNIGVIDGGRLVSFDWMDKPVGDSGESQEVLAEIAEAIGYEGGRPMSNIDIRALLGVPKHANQHRLSRLTMEVHTDELRIMASAVESYTDELIAALEVAEKRIAALEGREITLPPTFWYEHDDLSRDVPVMDARKVKKSIRDAGIRIAAAAGKGE